MNDELISERLLEVLNKATTIASMGIHVVDVHTREMYFSNEAGFRLLNLDPCDYKGLTCHKVFLEVMSHVLIVDLRKLLQEIQAM